ncbi:efflux RND transporter permease subunit [Endozoicomonas elysicola]|uniref:efflux RND transporter permease subunit n=1 Tax=Endozoicomonas elysicola TaxID=305900 RepID=UPI00036A515D|nr:efflux RND transporter permease subunit [Endozoicomonas elysicola]
MSRLSDALINRGPIAWMARNSVTANLLMLFFIVGGLLTSFQIRKEVYPNYQLNSVKITVSYSGATPDEMEMGIVLPIENAIRGIEGIKQVNSRALGGFANITAELVNNVNVDRVLGEIESEVNRTNLPAGAEKPRVTRSAIQHESMELILYGDVDPVALRETTSLVRDTLLRSPYLTQVEMHWASKYEVKVYVDKENLERYGLTLDSLSNSISRYAVTQSGGKLETAGGDILVEVDNRQEWAKDFSSVPVVSTAQGGHIYLDEIATIEDGFADRKFSFFYNGKPSTSIKIYRVGDQTPIGISEAVHDMMPQLQALLPPGILLEIVNDDAILYEQRMALLLKNAFSGLVLVLVVLALFLDLRLAFWVTMGIPTAFLGSLIFLPAMDVSINMISMFAFIIALGIVVDDAIIAGENVYDHMNQGMPFAQAAIIGVKDIAVPLTFSILTNIVAFIPIWFLPGTMGMMFQVIPLVVITVFAISWIEALFILPAHLVHLKNDNPALIFRFATALQALFNRGLNRLIVHFYKPVMRVLLEFRYLVVALGIAMLMTSISYIAGGHMGFTTMPKVEAEFSVGRATLPVGTSLEDATAIRHRLERSAQKVMDENGGKALVKGISSIQRNLDGEFIIIVRMFLQPSEVRTMSTKEVSRLWRESTGTIPGVEGIRFSSAGSGPGSDVAGVTIEMRHHDNNMLEEASNELAMMLAGYAGVIDIENTFSSGSSKLNLKLLPAGQSLGLNEKELAKQVRSAFNGVRSIRQQRGSEEVDIKVMLPDYQRASEFDLEQLPVRVGNDYVPLGQVASITRDYSASVIQRREGRRRVIVSADITPSSEAMTLSQTLSEETFPILKQSYPGLDIGFRGDQIEQKESMDSLFVNGIMVMLALYCLLAIPFRSYSQPFIIMAIIPFGLIGSVLGHVALGYTMSVVSLLGVLALSGVVINDSLILVTEANERREKDMLGVHDALLEACHRRFRPIILTTLTTFGGLAPMILETSNQARFMIPMAISLGFGILFATFITLLLLPCMYSVLEDIKGVFTNTAYEAEVPLKS